MRKMMTFKGCPAFFVLSLFYLISAPVQAQYFAGSVAQSQGGAGRAAIDQSEMIVLNPAALPFAKSLSFGFFYQQETTPEELENKNLALTALDATEGTFFKAAIAYAQKTREISETSTSEERYYQLTFGDKIFEGFSLGASFVHLKSELDSSTGKEKTAQSNAHLGLFAYPLESLSLGVVYYNALTQKNEKVPEGLQLKRRWAVGASYVATEDMRLRMDVVRPVDFNPEKKWILQAGFERYIGEFIIGRIGFEENAWVGKSSLSFGLGFAGPQFHMDYSYLQHQGEKKARTHSLDLRVPF